VDSKSIEYDDHIVLVVNNNRDNLIRESEFKTLKEFIAKHNLYGGISRCFTKITDMKKHYNQALTAIKIGYHVDKQALLYNYESLVIFEMFDACSTQKNLKDLCHPSLISLVEYDTKYKTNFVQTLYAYLENDKSQTATAKVLNIHRNTISYRMRKIAEIMKVDFNDTMLALRLYLSFKILDYINLNNTETDLTFD
jgi:DNA-binding PucR family transcriptional regulator